MRAFWTGEIGLGIIPIPVKMYSATKDLTPQFHQLHSACGTRISTVRRCVACERDVGYDEIVKGHEVAPNEYVPFTKEELAELSDFDGKGVIRIVHTVALTGVDPLYLDTPYYLAPATKRVAAFNLLRNGLAKSGLVAIAIVALRTRPKLCMLAAHANLIALTTMHYAAEIIDAKEIAPPEIPLREQDAVQVQVLLDTMVEEFHPENHDDAYVKKLAAAVQEKVEEGQTTTGSASSAGASSAPKPGGEIVDLAEMLAQSIKARAEAKARAEGAEGKSGKPASAPEAPAAPAAPAAPEASAASAPKDKSKGKRREGRTPSRRAS
jgi:DNA end-binding protein Ku